MDSLNLKERRVLTLLILAFDLLTDDLQYSPAVDGGAT
jgi:hypothetical protein